MWALEHVGSVVVALGLSWLMTWDLPGQKIEPVPPTLAGGFLISGPLGKSDKYFCTYIHMDINFLSLDYL